MAGDEVYGADPDLRRGCRSGSIGYVVGIGANCIVTTGTEWVDVLTASRRGMPGSTAQLGWRQGRPLVFPAFSASPRATPTAPRLISMTCFGRNEKTGESAYYRSYSPPSGDVATSVPVAGWH